MSTSPKYVPVSLSFRKGEISARDASVIPKESFEELTNFVLDVKNCPTKIEGLQKYNSTETGTDVPVKGGITFVAEDGVEYIIKACNNALYWSAGDGAFTAVKYGTENVAVVIDTANYDYEFVVFPKVISSVQKWCIYVVADDYPVSNTANGTANKYCSISRGLRLQVSGGVIIAKNLYYDSDNSRTAGADDVEVGQGSGEEGFPKQARFGVSIFDRLVWFGPSEFRNGWLISEAQDGEDYTPTSGANYGGGKIPEEYTAAVVLGSYIISFTRNSIITILASASSLTNWREVIITRNYGALDKRCAYLHSDGWVYFISEKGFCRTNGRDVEKADYAIEQKILTLPQLVKNKYSWELASTSVFDAGTPTSGDNLLDTSNNELKQKINTAIASLQITNNDFELALTTGWTTVGTGWERRTGIPKSGNYSVSMVAGSSFERHAKILLASDNSVLVDHTLTGTDDTFHSNTFTAVELAAYIGIAIKIQFEIQFGTPKTLTSDSFTYDGGTISFWWENYTAETVFNVDCILKTNTMSTTYDFGVAPSVIGNLVAKLDLVGGDTIAFYAETKDTDTSWNPPTLVGTATSGTYFTCDLSGLTKRRYMRIMLVLTLAGETTNTTITGISVGAQWISAVKDITYTPSSYGLFDCDFTLNGQTLTFEMNTSADNVTWDGWTTIVSGAIPAVTKRQYIKYRITFNTTNYTQIPYLERLTQYWFKSASTNTMPCMYSDGDKIYASLQSASGSTNDHCWIGQTRQELEALSISKRSGVPYPEWSYCNLYKANVFTKYRGLVCFGESVEGYIHQITGNTNNGTAFTSTLITATIHFSEVEAIFRELFLFSKSDQTFSLYVRTRRGVNNWSAWSTAKTIALAPLITRSALTVLAGLVDGDYAQFKIETTVTDANLELQGIIVYISSKPKR